MPKTHVVHLVQDNDRSKKACNGEPYTPPVTQQGDLVRLCQECALTYNRRQNDG